jgi:hypothetical protein
MLGLVPVLMTMARAASMVVSPTCTRPGADTLASPRMKRPPLPSNRSTATRSSQSSVPSSRMRRATGSHEGDTVAWPAIPGMRLASASRLPARIIILEGTQPQ